MLGESLLPREAGATAMLGIAVICFGEDGVRTLVLVERFGEAAL